MLSLAVTNEERPRSHEAVTDDGERGTDPGAVHCASQVTFFFSFFNNPPADG